MDDLFVRDLERRFGDFGYAFWFKTLELIASQGEGGKLIISWSNYEEKLHKRQSTVRQVLDFCHTSDKLLVNYSGENIILECKNFLKFADNYTKYGQELQSNFKETLKQEEKRTDKKRREENIYTSQHFSFLWKQYPKRVGSKHAERHFLASVKTEKDWENIQTALLNYLRSGNVKNGFIQNGSTWFNQWQDWIEPNEQMMRGNSNSKSSSPPIETVPIRSGWWTCPECKERMLESYQLDHECQSTKPATQEEVSAIINNLSKQWKV